MGWAMLTGFVLFYVGAVLFLNGLWLMGKIADREIIVINIVTALVSASAVLHDVYGAGADGASIRNGTLSLLFCTTYFWVAYNRFSGVDGRGLGWFSLFVAITAVPVALDTLLSAHSALDWWMGINWAAWALLWALFFALLALKKPIERMTGWLCIAQGVLTGWIPGYLILAEKLF